MSVVIVSDYGGRSAEDWRYLRDTLDALGRQRFGGRVELILVDSTPDGETMPPELVDLVASLRVLRGPKSAACRLLNEAARSAAADLIALLDGDCAPAPDWLEAAVAAMRTRPEAAVVSGVTRYPDAGFTHRVLSLLSRSFLDPGRAGATRFVSSNNAIFRRDALLAHPLGHPPRALASRLQTEAIRLGGGALYFEPRMRVTHRFEGWPMERRIRRNVGYRAVRIRQLDPRIPHAWMIRLGPAAIPLLLAGRLVESWWNCLRAGRRYGVRWYELPAALATAVGVHLMEIGGMRAAFNEGRTGPARNGPS